MLAGGVGNTLVQRYTAMTNACEGEGKNTGVEAALTHFVHTFGARIAMQRAFLDAVLRRLYDSGLNCELLAEHLYGLQSDVSPNLKDTPVVYQEAARQELKTLIEMVELLIVE